MQRTYTVVKELKAPIKIFRNLFLFDVAFVLGFMMIAYLLKIFVQPIIQPTYFIFSVVMALILTSKPPKNPQKRVFNVIYYWIIKDRYTYHAISIAKEKEF